MYKYVKCVSFLWPVKKTKLNYKAIKLLLYIHIYIVVVVNTVKKRFSSIKHKLKHKN